MNLDHNECLHCLIVREIGRRLDRGEICGKSALDRLVLVMADLLAMASCDEVEANIKGIIQDLSEAAAQARERAARDMGFAFQS